MTKTAPPKVTPMMAQWYACKEKAKDAVLLFRLGDFYESFEEDAITIAKSIDLTLTKRGETPMCGVPHHTAETYIDRLVAKGHKVAIAEQVEDPKEVKGIVHREVVRVVTPGTLVNSSLLSEKSNNYLVALTQHGSVFGLAQMDITTGEFIALEFERLGEVMDELTKSRPSEIVISEKSEHVLAPLLEELPHHFTFTLTRKAPWQFDHRGALDTLHRALDVRSLDGFGLGGKTAGIMAAGALYSYVSDELSVPMSHVTKIGTKSLCAFMAIDRSTQNHLELTNSLLKHLDRTETPMGARLLKTWLMHPLVDIAEIRKRQDGVELLIQSNEMAKTLSERLSEVRDLERLIMRISSGYGSPRDLVSLRFSLEQVPSIALLLEGINIAIMNACRAEMCDLSDIAKEIAQKLTDSPPMRLSDGGFVRKGADDELDELFELKENSADWLARYQEHLRTTHDIKTLKVSYNRAFGFYIEVSRAQSDRMPDTFERRQTLVNSERFISPELKEYEVKVLRADESIARLEQKLFQELREKVAAKRDEITRIAGAIATLDTLLSLATVARGRGYVRPVVDESDHFEIIEGRHPVLEKGLLSESFISNDTRFDTKAGRLHLITGPNMAGKSTFLRQTALIAIMAQMGGFVPAKKVHIGAIDKVFSRIGASDDLARGHSTFMVEMTETANILNNATSRSLVLLDEIGRGTSTYDGISIAWAVAEYLLKTPERRPKTLFATHYWELTELEKEIDGAINYNVAVYEGEGDVVFLRKIVRGGTDKSYGIHVAKLAGLPASAIVIARRMLKKMEGAAPKPKRIKEDSQLFLFTPKAQEPSRADELFAKLKEVDPNAITPLDALQLITEWKNGL